MHIGHIIKITIRYTAKTIFDCLISILIGKKYSK